jgi:SAM-dependent methyltransferase
MIFLSKVRACSPMDFWTTYQPGFRFTDEEQGTRAFYDAVEQHRYELEPHILEIARFDSWASKDVLDVGCGIATDGARFARAGARYTGIDPSPAAVSLARKRFDLEGLAGKVIEGSATALPFEDASFDLVWSHGVIHHIPDTDQALTEFKRVLRPGGTAIVMLYHRNSFNYYVTIMGIRRLLAVTLMIPGGVSAVGRVTGESAEILVGHRKLLAERGFGYLTDRQFFLSNNTDGPGNPLSKVYSRRDVSRLFYGWSSVRTEVRYLNARIYPGGRRLERARVGNYWARRAGWHLYVIATK